MWENETFSGIFFCITWLFSLHNCIELSITFNIIGFKEKIFINNDVSLECRADGPVTSMEIIRLADGHRLNISDGSHKSVTYFFHPIKCEDMGTYDCLVNGTTRRTLYVSIYSCPPQPCEGSDSSKTIFVKVNETLQFSFCVMNVGELYKHARFNDTLIRKVNTTSFNDTLIRKVNTTGLQNLTKWNWTLSEIILKTTTRDSTVKFWNITVINSQVNVEDYGHLNIRLFSTQGEQYYLDYNVGIYLPGPPECPTSISANETVLSWKPGLDGGSEQTFYVFTSSDQVTWCTHVVPPNQTYLNLPQEVSYFRHYIRVASTNWNQTAVNETTCNNTIMSSSKISGKSSSPECTTPPSQARHSLYLYIFTPICVILAVLAASLAVFLYRQRVITKRYKDRCETFLYTNSGPTALQTSGQYVSEEGLTYVTIIHEPNKSGSLKSNKNKINNQDVEYAALDFVKTEQLKMDMERKTKRTKGLLPKKKKSRHHTRQHKTKEK